MQFVALRADSESKLGVVIDDQILDLTAPIVRSGQAGLPFLMREVFRPDSVSAAQAIVRHCRSDAALCRTFADASALVPLASADLGPPIADPGLLLAIGMNYHDHVREMNTDTPQVPYAFTKSRASIIGPYDDIVIPASFPDHVDLEAELVVVIGSPCYRASEEEAARCIGGYTIANDVSARDWVAPVFQKTKMMDIISAWEQNLLGKQFPTFCPLGPFLVTSDGIRNVLDLKIASRVNGTTFQSSDTGQLIFSPIQLVSHYSQFYQFETGDMILTGTTAGVGFSRKPPYFLKPGDLVEVEIESLGALANHVVAEQ